MLNNTIQDFLARKARMDGKEVLWLPGTTTPASPRRRLSKDPPQKGQDETSRRPRPREVPRACLGVKEKHGGIIIQQLKNLGCSCDWSRPALHDGPGYSRCVQRVFVELYKKGLIYRGKRMVNWDPAARTALSDEEVEMVETKGHLWHLKYPRLDAAGQPIPDQFVVVATTRPETMLGDEAVAVNPKDEHYTKLVGTKVRLPLQDKPIPIIADEFVDPQFGTGCVKVTPAHDPNDYAMWDEAASVAVHRRHRTGRQDDAPKRATGSPGWTARKRARRWWSIWKSWVYCSRSRITSTMSATANAAGCRSNRG